jgi:nucleotide-binding universal stress UspA family protein
VRSAIGRRHRGGSSRRSPRRAPLLARKLRPFRAVLVPLDGSPLAEQAIPLALEITRAAGSKVRLVLVHQSPLLYLDSANAGFWSIDLAVRKAGREYLRGLAARLRETPGPRVSSEIIDGPVGPALVEYVLDLEADLVVMTTHGHGGLRGHWLGSVVDHLIRRLEVPVIVVRAREEPGGTVPPPKIRKILVPLDGSPLAEAALAPASAIAGLFDAELLLVQVVRPFSAGSLLPVPFAAGYDAEVMALRRKETQGYLGDLAEGLRERGLRATGTVVVGHKVVETLLDLTHQERIGLVAVATHGRSGFQRLVLGSVADKLIRAAEMPVLVVRPGKGR